ncbi:MAG TPA: hypothetical protein PK743_03110, partial [Luteimonas sp.]|nr:hypothetical protein [Luteimonas sp.]
MNVSFHKPSFETLVERMYASLLDESALPDFIRGLSQAFDSHFICVQRDVPGNSYTPIAHFSQDGRRTDEMVKVFLSSGLETNDLMDPSHAARLIRAGIEHDEGMALPRDFEQLHFYHQVMRPLDLRHSLGFCLHHDDSGRVDVLNVNRSRRRGHYNREDMQLARRLLPHLRNVHHLQRGLGDLGDRAAALEHAGMAVWLLDREGKVVHANTLAGTAATANTGLAKTGAYGLRTAWRADLPALRKAIEAIASGVSASARVPLRDCHGAFLTVAHLHTLPQPALGDWMLARPAPILLLVRPCARNTPTTTSINILRQAFGLTPAETRLAAALVEYGSLAACRDALGKSHETLRSQLKALLAKTGSRGQPEL